MPLWIETDGVVDWVRGFIASERVAAPSAPPLILQPSASEEAAPASDSKMFEGMFFTALEMATESVSWHAAPLRTSKR